MKLRTLLGATAGGLALAGLTDRVLRARAGDLEPGLVGSHGTYRWRGLDVSYTEAGDPADPDLLLLHGVNAAASSREFAPALEHLAADHHVIAPDLPGFGCSDRPPLAYSGSLYVSFVRDAARDLADEPACVASSLSGAYAAAAAGDAPLSRLVLVCPTAETMSGRHPWLRSVLRSPLVGQTLFNLVASQPSIRHFHAEHGYYDISNLSEGTVDYEWRTAHQPGARYAPASFVSGFLDLEVDLGETLGDLDVPVTLVWGRAADLPPLSTGRDLAERADVRLVVFDESRLLPHVEHPAQFGDLVSEELPRLEH